MIKQRKAFRSALSISIALAMVGCTSTPPGDGTPASLFADPPVSNVLASNLDIARAEFGRGNYGNAIEYLEKELTQKPASVAALNGLGACYDQLGRYDVAQRYYFRALDLSPESSRTLSNIGYSYLQQGRHREAVALLELALQKDGGNQVAANNLALARAGLEETAPAVQVARSTNNGDRAADEMDFMTLLSLLQGTADDSPATAGAGAAGTGSRATNAAVTQTGTVSASIVRVPEPAAGQLVRRTTLQDRGQPDQVTVTAGPEIATTQQNVTGTGSRVGIAALAAGEPAVNEAMVPGSESLEPFFEPEPLPRPETASRGQQVTSADEGQWQNAPAASPVESGQPASLAVITGQAIAVTDVIEPVPADENARQSVQDAVAAPRLNLTIIDAPQLDPARVSDMAPSLASLVEPLNLVVQNGNGVRGIARATSNWLEGEKLDIRRVGDAEHFDYARTVIYYRPELAPYAQEIAASLNLSCDLRPSTQLAGGTDVQVVLGHDFASQVSVGRDGIQFESTPSTDYLATTVRLEVSNGNGVNGMAARVREYLRAKGGNVVRISDADSYNYQKTRLFYRQGVRIAAQGLAATLPLSEIELVESRRLRPETDALLIIGADFMPVDILVSN